MARRIPTRLILAALIFTLFAAPRGANATWWEAYKNQFDKKVAEVEAMDKWGNTAFPPRGILAFKYTYNWVRANKRFNADGSVDAAVPPLELLDNKLDFGLSGTGSGHKFQFFYGITNDVALFLEIPIQRIIPAFNIQYTTTDNGLTKFIANVVGGIFGTPPFTELEGLWQTLELLGRPRPNTNVEDKDNQIGDISLALAWNYFRSDLFSCATGGKLTFPTGAVADPDNALTYALGPEIDIGQGSYAIEVGHILDMRPPDPFKWFILTLELYTAYYFEAERPAPHFGTPNPDLYKFLNSGFAKKALGTEEFVTYFPDLSGLDEHMRYRPGSQFKWVVQISPTFAWWFPISCGFQGIYFEESVIKANVQEFADFVDAFGLVGNANRHEFWGKATIGLFPLRIPATLAIGFNYYLAGKNVLILEDNYDVNVQIFCPWELAIPWL